MGKSTDQLMEKMIADLRTTETEPLEPGWFTFEELSAASGYSANSNHLRKKIRKLIADGIWEWRWHKQSNRTVKVYRRKN